MKSRVLSDSKVKRAIVHLKRFVIDASARDPGTVNEIRDLELGLPGFLFCGGDTKTTIVGSEVSVESLIRAAGEASYTN